MNKVKIMIFIILFMMIGFATVSVSLSITGNAKITGDIDDFKVYFSDVKVNDIQDLTIVKSETELNFDVNLESIGSVYKITYDVTNASKMFDAELSVSCTQGNEYISIINDFDSSTLSALTTRTGNLTLKKLKANASETDTDYQISCSIIASPVERDSQAVGEVVVPINPITFDVGDVVSINGENFNIISQTEENVTMLAQYVIGDDNLQDTYIGDEIQQDYYINSSSAVEFSGNTGWTYVDGMKDIDIFNYDMPVTTVVNNYVAYLQEKTGDLTITGNLITLLELKELGCTVYDDYATTPSCTSSSYIDWLDNKQHWWTRSVITSHPQYVWFMWPNGRFDVDYDRHIGVRPIITISKSTILNYM